MRNPPRLIDIHPEDRIVPGTLKLNFNKFVALAFDSFHDQLPEPVPIYSYAHNNKKVGETPTPKSSLAKYRCALRLNQPPFDRHLTTNTLKTKANPIAVLYSRLAMYCRNENEGSNWPNFGMNFGTRAR